MNRIELRTASRSTRAIVVAALVCSVILGACKGSDTAANSATPSPATGATDVASGEEIFARCAVCHQASGAGVPAVYPPLAGSAIALGDPGIPIRILLHGLQGELVVKGEKFNGVMLPGGGVPMSDEDIASVLTYVRSSFGNSAPAVTVAAVAAVRAETASRTESWTPAELEKLSK